MTARRTSRRESRRAATWLGAAVVVLTVGAVVGAGLAQGGVANLSFHPPYSLIWHGGVASNGRYTMLWGLRGPNLGMLLDESTGRRTEVGPPPGCRRWSSTGVMPELGESWLLADCNRSRVELYSLAAERWRAVTVARACRQFRGGSCTPQAVGADWIEYDESSVHLGDRFIFQNIATGAVRRDPTNAGTVPNLDSRALAQPVCPPLRVPHGGTLQLDGQFALASGPHGTFLERCGTTLHRSLIVSPNIVITPSAIMWVLPPNGPLRGIFLPSLQAFTVAPVPHASMDVVALSSRRLYVVGSTRRTGIDVWSAPAPALPG